MIIQDGLLVSGSWDGLLNFWDYMLSETSVLSIEGEEGIMSICPFPGGEIVTGDKVCFDPTMKFSHWL